MSKGLSIFAIKAGLWDLVGMREELATEICQLQDALAAADQTGGETAIVAHGQLDAILAERQAELETTLATLRDYIGQQVDKVDDLHSYLGWCEQAMAEAKAVRNEAAERARVLDARAERLKDMIVGIMAATGEKRLYGTAGRYLLRKPNGGLARVLVDGWDQESGRWLTSAPVLPAEFQDVTVKMNHDTWLTLQRLHFLNGFGDLLVKVDSIKTEPCKDRIRAALADKCPKCYGTGEILPLGPSDAPVEICQACDGTKLRKVPGARIGARGEHLERK